MRAALASVLEPFAIPKSAAKSPTLHAAERTSSVRSAKVWRQKVSALSVRRETCDVSGVKRTRPKTCMSPTDPSAAATSEGG